MKREYMLDKQPIIPDHSREFIEYLWDVQPNGNILFLIDSLVGNIHVLADHLPLPTTEEEQKMYMLHDFMINKVGS